MAVWCGVWWSFFGYLKKEARHSPVFGRTYADFTFLIFFQTTLTDGNNDQLKCFFQIYFWLDAIFCIIKYFYFVYRRGTNDTWDPFMFLYENFCLRMTNDVPLRDKKLLLSKGSYLVLSLVQRQEWFYPRCNFKSENNFLA